MDFREHSINRDWTVEDKIGLLRQMLRIRKFEHGCLRGYINMQMAGWMNLDIGQESIAAGVRSLLGCHDHTISGSRGIGHAIAAGMDFGACMAEFYGKQNGCSKGKSGMFSFFAPDRNHWGCHGLAAAQTPLAAGLAFALKQREISGAVVCFLGDGATNQGVYHESLNLAGLFGLPVVYIIENNLYAMGTSVERSSRFTECLARRAETYGIDWDRFSDADPYEIRARVWTALERARRELKPTVLEIDTYRYYGASIADANHKKYRTPEEIEERRARDPLGLWKNHLLENHWISQDEFDTMLENIKQDVFAAERFAADGAPPTVGDIVTDVYWESDHDTPASRIGRHFFND
jgi:pyruvate dehydrogenase E1 component alpha subunit